MKEKKGLIEEKYANQQLASCYAYPHNYKPKPIEEQIKIIGDGFKVDSALAFEFAKNLPSLPEGAEAFFAFPKISAIARKFFPVEKDPFNQYFEAVKIMLEMTKYSHRRYNGIEAQIAPNRLRQNPDDLELLRQIEEKQPGDIIIVPGQLGMWHRGESCNRARETFADNEFGFGIFMVYCILLFDPNRLTRREELGMYCIGDELSIDSDHSLFSQSPSVYCNLGRICLKAKNMACPDMYLGAVSGFLI